MGVFARAGRFRRTWAVVTAVFTFVVIPLTRWLWRRHVKSVGSKKDIIDVTAEVVKKEE